jgi:hypothetical protein
MSLSYTDNQCIREWYANCLSISVQAINNFNLPKLKTMTTNTTTQEAQAELLKTKIMELKSALFFTESASIVKLPTHVISEVEMDAEGQIWFVIPRPVQHLEAFEKEMPAKLDFFKKGKDFFIKITGVAFLITDMEEVNNNLNLSEDMRTRMNDKNVIGVKVMVQKTDWVDNTPKPTQNWLQASRSQLSSWFF